MGNNNENKILMGHGSGGRMGHDLIKEHILKYFKSDTLALLHDSAILELPGNKVAFTTDSFVIKPIFFPGGNIGKLAVAGTVNDISVAGANPLYMSVGFIIEEGFNFDYLDEILKSMYVEAKNAGVEIVTGDTKIVEKGVVSGIYINTTAIGVMNNNIDLGPSRISIGDDIIINGTIGDHGGAVMAVREGIDIKTELKSDCASLNKIISRVCEFGESIKFMRDPTRGGVAAILNEIVDEKEFGIEIYEEVLPYKKEVLSISELLGLDPLFMANEGKFITFCRNLDSENIINSMKKSELGKNSAIIGKVTSDNQGMVIIKSPYDTGRILDWPNADPLPRIC